MPPRGKHGNHARGSRNGRWNPDRLLTDRGYVLIRVGKSHPLANPNGYAFEHKIVICAALLRRLEPGEVVHHRNGDRTDNRLENLELLAASEHSALHVAKARRDASGRFLPRAA